MAASLSLNDKYDGIYNKNQFYLIYHVYHYVSMDWSINFRNTDFGCAQRFGRHDHQICI